MLGEWLYREEAAEYLHIVARGVSRYYRRGKLSTRKAIPARRGLSGREFMYLRSEVEALACQLGRTLPEWLAPEDFCSRCECVLKRNAPSPVARLCRDCWQVLCPQPVPGALEMVMPNPAFHGVGE